MPRAWRLIAAITVVGLGSLVLAPATPAQIVPDPGSGGSTELEIPRPVLTGQCIKPEQGKELYGPTDVNAQAGNQGLSVAFNAQGTVTVFKWPSPSFYDQVKYHTNSRAEPYTGAQPNEGLFLGLAVTTAAGESTVWLRDFADISQEHATGLTDELHTTYRDPTLGLAVTVVDVVTHPDDVLVRDVTVERLEGSPVTDAALVAYENFNLVVSKLPALPVQDWCLEGLNIDTAAFDAANDAIVHSLSGIDVSTLSPTSVAVAMGFDGASTAHQVGGDAHEPLATPDGKLPLLTYDAYEDAADGTLTGNDNYLGQTTGAMTQDLDFDGGRAESRVLFAAAATPGEAVSLIGSHRSSLTEDLAAEKRRWVESQLDEFPLPNADDEFVLGVAERALVVLLTDIDRSTKSIVASITTQSPYGADWPRDGAFFDYALDLGGLHDLVSEHHAFYSDTQQTLADPDLYLTALAVPPGNWGMNYYADGVVGGPIPWEIDETGYAVWNFWQHYLATGDLEQLRTIWPTLSAAADFLMTCADPLNGLQCLAIEDDNPDLRQTNVGASSTWMALDAAAAAAKALDEQDAARRYAKRRDELGEAIDRELWINDPGHYGPGALAVTVWPMCFKPYDHPRMVSHFDRVWSSIAPTFTEPEAGKKAFGLYEAKGVLSLAKAWKGQPDKMAMLRDALDWIVREHATSDTHVMGEVWKSEGGEIISIQAQPHAWEQILTYLAAIELYPPSGFEDVGPGCDGVLGAIRDARRSAGSRPPSTEPAAPPPSTEPTPTEATTGSLPATGGASPAVPATLLALAGLTALGIRNRHATR